MFFEIGWHWIPYCFGTCQYFLGIIQKTVYSSIESWNITRSQKYPVKFSDIILKYWCKNFTFTLDFLVESTGFHNILANHIIFIHLAIFKEPYCTCVLSQQILRSLGVIFVSQFFSSSTYKYFYLRSHVFCNTSIWKKDCSVFNTRLWLF